MESTVDRAGLRHKQELCSPMSDYWVFWDFDGTLGFGPHGPGAWSPCLMEALDHLHPGHDVPLDAIRPGLRGGYPWHSPDVPHPELDSAEKWWAPLRARFASIFAEAGYENTATELAQAACAFYADGSRWSLYDDALPALKLLRDAGVRQGILSNNIPELERNCELLGLDEFMSVVLSSAVTGFEKPHPESYRRAVCAAPGRRDVWMVGDSYEADVSGAEQAGLNAILIRRADSRAQRSASDALEAAALILHSIKAIDGLARGFPADA